MAFNNIGRYSGMRNAHESFLCLVQPRQRALSAAAQQYAASVQDAHDLVQETLLRAWRNFSVAKERKIRPSWLFVIMRNVCLEWHRTAQRRVKITYVPNENLTEIAITNLQDPFPLFGPLTEEQFRELLDEHLVEAFDALNPGFREVLVLAIVGDLNYREIAEVLDCPVGTVMSRMARARRELREHLACRARTQSFVRKLKS